ncbi:hypothetical protein AAC387_Pa05g2484 [Persea americana]
MEFKYRAGEDPSFSFDPYLTSIQSIRGGILGGEARRPDMLRGPMMSAREALRRELEKDRIREEILAREILRRRELEEEVRREMAFEREIALRRQADRFSLAPSSASLPRQASPRLLELRSGERAAVVSPRNVAEDISTAENGSRRRISEVKEEADASLGKPSTTNIIAGTKRKAACVEDLLQLPSPKKAHKSWSCALCEVSTTSEKGLKEHIEGKKHKAKEKQQQAKAVEIGKKAKFTFKCEHCHIKCNSEPMMVAHLKGRKHAVRVQELLTGDEAVPEIKTGMKDVKSEETSTDAENVEQGNMVAAETKEVVIGEGTEATGAPVIKEAQVVEGEEEEAKMGGAASQDNVEGAESLVDEELTEE